MAHGSQQTAQRAHGVFFLLFDRVSFYMGSRQRSGLDELADFMNGLASSTRLELLANLASPKNISSLRIAGSTPGATRTPAVISKQAVRKHLDRLMSLGLVREVGHEDMDQHHWVADRARLYALSEAMTGILLRYGGLLFESEGTLRATADQHATPSEHWKADFDEPRVVIVHGAYVGRPYSLGGGRGRCQWRLGRHTSCEVRLDYDPYVSREHAVITKNGGTYFLAAMPGTRNVTSINGDDVREKPRQLRPGDIILVGRSRLVFQTP